MTQTLKADNSFSPVLSREGDEHYPNGIFVFNVTRILEYIDNNPQDVSLVDVNVHSFHPEFSSINETHVESVDISRPLVLAEISPGNYNLIYGHHRVEKARRLGVDTLPAYKLTVLQHIIFLTSKKAYLTYIEYWNGKVAEKRRISAETKKGRR